MTLSSPRRDARPPRIGRRAWCLTIPGSIFRKAADTDAHDEAIVANINRIVGEDDELWILGDIGYRTSVRHLKSCLRQLRCRHLHAVIGNHDDWWLVFMVK